MLNQIIAIFLPSVISLKIHNKLKNDEGKLTKNIENYLIYFLLVNLVSLCTVVYLFKQQYIVFTYVFTIKYIMLSIVTAIVLPVIARIISNNIGIEIKVEKNEEKN